MDNQTNTRLGERAEVQALLGVLLNNRVEAMEVKEMLHYIAGMENQLDQVSRQLAAVNKELAQMHSERQHPVRAAVQNTADSLEAARKKAAQQLGEVKADFCQGCNDAVAAFRARGASALTNLAGYFHLRQGLEHTRSAMQGGVKSSREAMTRVTNASAALHQSARDVRNIGRAMMGREQLADSADMGALAQTAQRALRAERNCFLRAVVCANGAINSLDKLERSAQPSVRDTIRNAQAEPKPPAADREEKTKSQEASR